MRFFLSPAEQALLDALPQNEQQIVRDLFDQLDGHLVEEIDSTFGRGSSRPARAWWNETEAA